MGRPFPIENITKVEMESGTYPHLGQALATPPAVAIERGRQRFVVHFKVWHMQDLNKLRRPECFFCHKAVFSTTCRRGYDNSYEIMIDYRCQCLVFRFFIDKLEKEWATIKQRVMAL